MSISFRTQAACQIARIDRDRFNEAVAADNYRCAPPTERGSSRLFAENDLIALYIYGRLLSIQPNLPPKIAGDFACRVLRVLEQNPNAKTISYLFGLAETNATVADASVFPLDATPGNPAVGRLEFDIVTIRDFIHREMKAEASVVGEDEK